MSCSELCCVAGLVLSGKDRLRKSEGVALSLWSITVCCSVLQCVAVCCSVLQCVVLRGDELQCVAKQRPCRFFQKYVKRDLRYENQDVKRDIKRDVKYA